MTDQEAKKFFDALSQVKLSQDIPDECKRLYALYKGFVEAGFNEDQSFQLLIVVMTH